MSHAQNNNINWRHAVSVYVSIGQKVSSAIRVYEEIIKLRSAEDCLCVISSAAEAAPLQFLSPYVGCAHAEYFRDNGMDSLVIYDDLTKHSYAYRQMSLLLKRSPGREAYPGDIFYIHSRLLERAAQLNTELGFGSLTAFPIIETQGGDIAAYIPTNIISITDGQLFLDTDIFYKGVRPAIHTGLSVSRVGSAAQNQASTIVSHKWRETLAIYREMEAFAQFGAGGSDLATYLIAKGARLSALLHQEESYIYSVEEQFVTLYAAIFGYMDHVASSDILLYEKLILYYFVEFESKEFFFDIYEEIYLFSMSKKVEKRIMTGLSFLRNYYTNLLI
jgi:proton translocating ATP synthase F1 alpha subunit